MRKIQVTLNIDDEVLLKESGKTSLDDAIGQELSWLNDSGMYVEAWSFMDPPEKQMQNFYYTFGTSKTFPFQKGWVQVQAEDREQADQLFRSKYPDNFPGYVNCAFVYQEDEFKEIKKQYENEEPEWHVCHDTLVQETHNERTLSNIIQSADSKKIKPTSDNTKKNNEKNFKEREGERG